MLSGRGVVAQVDHLLDPPDLAEMSGDVSGKNDLSDVVEDCLILLTGELLEDITFLQDFSQ